MKEDSIIQETRRIKTEIAAQYGNDVRKLGRALQEQQRREGRAVVSLRGKRTAAET